MTPGGSPYRYFQELESADFARLEHAAFLKGLLKPFKGKGTLETWASQCFSLRDDVIHLAADRVLGQARAYPFNLLRVQLAAQTTGTGTTFLRWRSVEGGAMGVSLWRDLMLDTSTPARLLDDLYAIEQHRVLLNMQISLLHSIGRQANECAQKLAQADRAHHTRIYGADVSDPPDPTQEPT